MGQPNIVLEHAIKTGHLLKWLDGMVTRQDELRSFPGVQKNLDELKEAGADPEMVLCGLMLLSPKAAGSYKKQFAEAHKRLSTLASRFERISKEVEALVSDPLSQSAFWKALLFEPNPDFTLMERRCGGATIFCKRLKVIVNFLRAEAKVFRTLGSDYERFAQIDRLGPVLRYVKNSTGEFHDDEMADLLQAAHDALGVQAEFTAEGLRKLRQRKFPDLVQKREQSAPSDEWLGLLLATPKRKLDKKPRKK